MDAETGKNSEKLNLGDKAVEWIGAIGAYAFTKLFPRQAEQIADTTNRVLARVMGYTWMGK